MSDSNELRFNWVGCHLIWDSNDLVVSWFEIQLIWLSSDLRFKWFWLSIDLRFNWFGCHLIWDSNDFGCQLIWDSNDLVVNRCVFQMILVVCWFELQVMWLSIDLRFKWFGCQLIWDSSDLVVNRFEIQMSWLSIDLRFKWFGCQMIWGSSDLVVNWCVIQMILSNEAFLRDFLQKRSISARLPSKIKLWSSKTKHLCETSFKNEALKSKAKLFCETSFKNAVLKLKNEAFLLDFHQKLSFEAQKRNISARLPSKMKLWRSKTKLFCETSFKNDKLTGHLTSDFQYVSTILKWMLQKYCACHEKVEPRHTKSCNCHAKWSLQSNTSVTWNLQPFHGFSVGGFKHRHHKARNHCACHVKRIVSEPLQIHHACQRFCNPANSCACYVFCNVSKSLRLPCEKHFEPPKTSRDRQFLTILTSESLSRAGVVQILRSSTSKSAPNMQRGAFFFVKIALARRRGANFGKLNFQKCSEHASF